MRKHIYISLLFLFFFVCVHAQQKKYVYQDTALINQNEDTATAIMQAPVEEDNTVQNYTSQDKPVDTTLYLKYNSFSADSVSAWRKNKGFWYMSYLDSLLKARKNDQGKPVKLVDMNREDAKAKEQPQSSSSSSDSSTPQDYSSPSSSSGSSWLGNLLASSATQVIFWILAGCFVLFILYKLFLTKGAFKRDPAKNTSTEEALVEEEIITHESDFDRMIRLAAEGGNFRLAVRYQYLKSLHALAMQQHVSMAVDKTNFQYVQEIKNSALRNDFAALTLNYEYVWYGEFAVSDVQYQKIAASFSGFNKKI